MMKYGIKIFLLICFFSIAHLQADSTKEQVFVWNDDDDYPPLIYKDKDGKARGIFTEIMQEIFQRIGVKLKCELYPWVRAQKRVKSGLADGMVTIYTRERKRFTQATDPILVVHERVFASSENPKIKELMALTEISQFAPYRVVDYNGAGWAIEHYKNLPHVIWAPKSANAFLMLANGRADIYVMSEFAGIYGIQEQIKKRPQYARKLKKIVMSNHILSTITYRLLIRNGSDYVSLIPKINQALREMKRDGTYDKILGSILGYMKGKKLP